MIAIVERGNTRTKLSVMDIKANIIESKTWNEFNVDLIQKFLSNDFENNRYCNTSRVFEVIHKKWHEVLSTSEWPIEINYSKNVGVDRVAGVTGARVVSKKKSLLVISCGTCLTFSYLNVKNSFQMYQFLCFFMFLLFCMCLIPELFVTRLRIMYYVICVLVCTAV